LAADKTTDRIFDFDKFSWKIFTKPPVWSVFILVALWNISVSSNLVSGVLEGEGPVRETLREIRDVNLHLQLRFYQVVPRLLPIPFRANDVSLVYIDDDTHWTTFYGDEPTNRAYLARVVRNASETSTKAQVIGLDIELLTPRHFPAGGDAEERFDANRKLLEAIQFATKQGVPVILASVYSTDLKGQRVLLPNIYSNEELLEPEHPDCNQVRCPGFGYINLPDDKRQIPLGMQAIIADSGTPVALDSFALAIAKADKGPIAAVREPILSDEARSEIIFGNFLPETAYPQISFLDLANGEASAKRACAGRIVMIGGNWRDLQGTGAYTDQHLSPAGRMSGLGLHANYVESLLRDRYTREWPLGVVILIDLLIGLIVYASFESAIKLPGKLIVLSATFLLPILCAYLSLIMVNLYLDFLLPVELYFLHILYEIVEKTVHQKLSKRHDLATGIKTSA
jgi:CHASE2 domain-containing sensor protein